MKLISCDDIRRYRDWENQSVDFKLRAFVVDILLRTAAEPSATTALLDLSRFMKVEGNQLPSNAIRNLAADFRKEGYHVATVDNVIIVSWGTAEEVIEATKMLFNNALPSSDETH